MKLRKGRPPSAGGVSSYIRVQPALGAARVAAGLTQAELARRIGVKRDALASWETGRSRAPAQAVKRMARVLRVAVDALECGA